jgi:hypothetical protein
MLRQGSRLTGRREFSGLIRTLPSIWTVDSTGTSESADKRLAVTSLRKTTSWVVPDASLIEKKDIDFEILLCLEI